MKIINFFYHFIEINVIFAPHTMNTALIKPTLDLEKYHHLQPGKWHDDEIKRLSEFSGLTFEEVKLVLKWDVITVQQMVLLCKVGESRIRNAISPYAKRDGSLNLRLTTVVPFPESTETNGRTFILVDDIARNYILSKIR